MPDHSFATDRYEKMTYRRCGRSGLRLPTLSLGFWQSLGREGNDELCRRCCYFAFDHGITHFDLANNYGPPPGNSEIVVGKILKDMPRDELIISTKAGFLMWPGPYGEWGSRKNLLASLDQSLKRLQLEYVDLFYHHRPDPDTPLDESLGALDQAVHQGKALYAGVSNYSGASLRQATDVVARHDWAPITIHQQSISMLNRKPITDLLPVAEERGVGVIAYCPLAQGRLTDRYLNGLPEDSRRGMNAESGHKWYEEQRAAGIWSKVAKLNEVAKARGQTMAQLALTWLLSDRRITSVLIGVSKVEQLKENLAVAKAELLSPEELRKIAQILEADA